MISVQADAGIEDAPTRSVLKPLAVQELHFRAGGKLWCAHRHDAMTASAGTPKSLIAFTRRAAIARALSAALCWPKVTIDVPEEE